MYVHCYALSICQLPDCNLFTQHDLSYGRDTSSELWTPVLSITLIQSSCYVYLLQALFSFIPLQTNISFPTIYLILCVQQNRWDWQPHCKLGQSILVMLCAGSMLLLTPVVRPAKVSQQHLQKWFLSPTSRLNFGFLLRENLLLCSSYLPLGFSPTVWNLRYVKHHQWPI